MAAYYNEIDLYAAEWLRNLMKAGHIADGEVDTRSIVDVEPNDIRQFDQCHFFAGIAGWSYALRLAGWADDRKIWTGSCPCQPFSEAGKKEGKNDPRHLWPHFFRLIKSCRPDVVMGEQVAGKFGYDWLDGVFFDLEGESYTAGAVDIPACSVNSPHIRQRLYWVAHTKSIGWGIQQSKNARQASRKVNASTNDCTSINGEAHINFWHDAICLTGADGEARRVKSGVRLLAHGVPARVGELRAYGNAIVPQVAAEVIKAFKEVTE